LSTIHHLSNEGLTTPITKYLIQPLAECIVQFLVN